ncbi:hypothetical protein VTJ83DRAFT_6016 [Remersonia thermophila]|uniref:FAD-binding FR-type domain-containing protein n=1 Tax=Remersonia thermophila TaxID=72144 RepID=A0ABR4D8H1_9PEZI
MSSPPAMAALHLPRHIQNFSAADQLEPHWGYADRVVPCVNDPGSCEYLDEVYGAHDRGMIYTGIFWLTIGGLLLVWAVGRRLIPHEDPLVARLRLRRAEKQPATTEPAAEAGAPPPRASAPRRLLQASASTLRRHLLPTTPLRVVFGRTTRLQVLILAVLAGYLAVWSFVGIKYAMWKTPIKDQPPEVYNTRSSLGPFADRVGVLAYALTPLSVLLASRESLLERLTGVPYTSFLFLHRWTGYLILVQSVVHTIGWVLIEAWLYKPQPQVWNGWIAQDYARWGVAALALLVLMWLLSTRTVVERLTGYEAFRKAHYVLAMVYIGALIGHWQHLQCFLVPGLVLWGLDRGARLVRTALLHYGYWPEEGRYGFRSVQATARVWTDRRHGDVVRLDLDHVQKPWSVGQHFFLCFPEGSIWQSHPFTPASLPEADARGRVRHSYVFRAKLGETKKMADLLLKKLAAGAPAEAASATTTTGTTTTTTPVILQGPYGTGITSSLPGNANVLCVAGGTGITYVLPVLLQLVRGPAPAPAAAAAGAQQQLELVWVVRRRADLEWVQPELDELRARGAAHGLRVRVFVTSDADKSAEEKPSEEGDGPSAAASTGSSGAEDVAEDVAAGRPDVAALVREFAGGVAGGPTRVFASGPPGMIVDLREAVAGCNAGARVWRGEEQFDVKLICDDRLEW